MTESKALTWQGTDVYVQAAANVTGSFALVAVSGETPAKITRATGSFITDGLAVGDLIKTSNATYPDPYIISAVAALELELVEPYDALGDVAAATLTLYPFIPLGEIKGTSGLGGGSAAVIDATHNRSTAIEKRKGLPDSGQMNVPANLLLADRGQQRIAELWASPNPADFILVYAPDEANADFRSREEFAALVMSQPKEGEVNGLWSISTALELTGPITTIRPPAA
jgi:hypothetical protein